MSSMIETARTDNRGITKETSLDPVDKRIYIGGLHPSITEDQIVERFGKFGTVSNVDIAKNVENECRGFAHMTIHTTPKQWEQCISVYNNAKWKGHILKLEEAQMDWQERKRLRDEKFAEKEEKKRKRLLRWNDSDGFHAKDMTPVTDNNVGTRKGWKRGRYGRAIAVMRLMKEDGTKFVFDPSHYKNNLTKLFNIGVRMKSVNKLITKVDDENSDDDDDDDWLIQQQQTVQQNDQNDSDATENVELVEDQQLSKQATSTKILFDTDVNNTQSIDDDDIANEENTRKEPIEMKKWMFDSEDEDEDDNDDYELKINPVFEGEVGRKRLELQKGFGGDERFKLSEDFIDEEEERKKAQKLKEDLGDEISQELGAEKNQALDVLRSMFGEEKVDMKLAPQSSAWQTTARYDPDAEDSTQYLMESKQTVEDENMEEEEEEEEEEDSDDLFEQSRKPKSALPIVSTDKHFEVNTNLKPLFGGAEEAPFTLFGDSNDNEKPTETKTLLSKHEKEESIPSFMPKQAPGKLGLGVFFFFHFDDPALLKRSCFAYDKDGIFQAKVDEEDSYENKWRTQRPVIKEILKKRQKKAIKNLKRRTKKDFSF
ncbi:hypothetical protein BDF20DRAFT_841940 [Mycotypha africana]|uniref:uncharacterized protein n=1 Tax=Mycotypha africana TaxID=64632 RepID=UPI0022FFE724|nr:uncharacterized protein BDF20DRAFT_841940 [Mycotypha africana]KAI8990967.1 hypothetical protein BDF20DRAFT_841940 [Mycotypha africana]